MNTGAHWEPCFGDWEMAIMEDKILTRHKGANVWEHSWVDIFDWLADEGNTVREPFISQRKAALKRLFNEPNHDPNEPRPAPVAGVQGVGGGA